MNIIDHMTNILRSASKLVFVLMALATVVALFTDKITGDQFLALTGMAFAYYFSKSTPSGTSDTQ